VQGACPEHVLAMCRVTALDLTYSEATGATGNFLNGAGRLVDLIKRIRVLEMPLLSAPGEAWCYVSQPASLPACLLAWCLRLSPDTEHSLCTYAWLSLLHRHSFVPQADLLHSLAEPALVEEARKA
jgi:hypothetical protein